MGRMTRTQISLDEQQYRFAKRRAAEQALSLSAYLRGLIQERMETEEEKAYDITDLIGLFEDGGVTAENVDEMLADEALARHRRRNAERE